VSKNLKKSVEDS